MSDPETPNVPNRDGPAAAPEGNAAVTNKKEGDALAGMELPIPDADPLTEVIDELQRDVSEGRPKNWSTALKEKPEFSATVFSVPVEIQVMIGSTKMLVSELMALEKNSIVTLNSKIGDPVDMLVNGTKVASGELEVMDNDPEKICIRITQLGR
ncbi:MAG: FliM/FliN family flagellar motor switch protein [Pseudomonadota bacterium]